MPQSTPVRAVRPSDPDRLFGLPKWAVIVIAGIGIVIAYFVYKSSRGSSSPGVPPQGGQAGPPYDTNLNDQSALNALKQEETQFQQVADTINGLLASGVSQNSETTPNLVGNPQGNGLTSTPTAPYIEPVYVPPPVVPPTVVIPQPITPTVGAGGAYSTGSGVPTPGGDITGRGIQGGL